MWLLQDDSDVVSYSQLPADMRLQPYRAESPLPMPPQQPPPADPFIPPIQAQTAGARVPAVS